MCSDLPEHRHHLLCDRPLCDKCILFRKYYFLCYKLIFEDEPLCFENHLKDIAKLFKRHKVEIYLKNVRKYAYCFHSEEFQKHHPCVPYPPHFFL